MTSQPLITKEDASTARIATLLQRTFSSEQVLSPVALRLALAVAMFPHGAQKAVGWFGGYGMSGSVEFFSSMGIPAVLSVGIILLEFLGPILLLLGLGTRLIAAGLGGIMVGAIVITIATFFVLAPALGIDLDSAPKWAEQQPG